MQSLRRSLPTTLAAITDHFINLAQNSSRAREDASGNNYRTMSDIFISYARSTQDVAERIAVAFRERGYGVWWDEELPAHRAYTDVIEERLRAAKAVVVVWSADAAKSQWVRAEADLARCEGKLVQLNVDSRKLPLLPLPFNQIECANLSNWNGDTGAHGWRKVVASVEALLAGNLAAILTSPAYDALAARDNLLVVLAFDNLSTDADLGYFSDGVSEEILYTVARTKGLRVVGKASSFQFRGQDKNAQKVADALGATHVLDGSVRRSGNDIRINVELVDTASLETLWSERYDRPLVDIFALQDEIAGAIAAALHNHFAPSRAPVPVAPAAYDLYLQARAVYAQDLTWADQSRCVALLEGAIIQAPDFAQAWGRLGLYRGGNTAIVAAQRGLELDPDCAISLAALSMTRPPFAQHTEKLELAERAYDLTPDDQIIAGVYVGHLVALGLLMRACEVSEARFARDPLSPLVAGGLAIVYRSAGRRSEAIGVADNAIKAFPTANYIKFIRGLIATFDGDIDCAAAMAASMSSSGSVQVLQMLVMFERTISAMDPAARTTAIAQFLRRNAPKSYFVDLNIAASLGEADAAMEALLHALRKGRPLEFTADNDGRAPPAAHTTSGLFMPNCEVLRRDWRFAEVCVRTGLYDCWLATDRWPDCVAEVSPQYDLKAECAKLADTVDRYFAVPLL